MNLKLNNKVVLISGGSSGIGYAISQQFLAAGSTVVVLDKKTYPNASNIFYIKLNLVRHEDCKKAIGKVIQRYGRIDILINNAGFNDGINIRDSIEAFHQSLEKNLIHYFSLVHFSIEHLIKSKGVILNIGSKVSLVGQGNTSGYAAAKGAINALTREWALDFSRYGIRVNAILPAEVMTPHYKKWIENKPDKENYLNKVKQNIPLGNRFTTPEEIAYTAVFLCSSCSSHTTGQIIMVDGGYVHLDQTHLSP